MKEETRRAVAYVAAQRIIGTAPESLYSCESRWVTAMSAGFDVDAQSAINASGASVYHHGAAGHINLQVNPPWFSGFAYKEGHHFYGSILEGSIEIYDYGEGRYYYYRV
jgi:hypothetical protein